MLTSTGKKQRTAAITIFESWFSVPNQLFVIGAKAMIGTAFAAMANGISAVASVRQRASTSAKTIAAPQPITQPPNASWNVNQPAPQSVSRSVQKASTIAEGAGSRKFWTSRARTRPSQSAIPPTKTTTAGIQSQTPRPTRAPSVPRGIGSTTVVLNGGPPRPR